MTKVTLINFGDATRVFYEENRKTKTVDVGAVVDANMTDTAIARARRDESMVIMDPDVADKNPSGLMRTLLDTLRNWTTLSMDDRQAACDKILGVGSIGQRPSAPEMRFHLAKRAKDAAYYVQQGANETADELLGRSLPSIEEQKRLREAAKPKVVDKFLVKGDDDDSGPADTDSNERSGGSSGRQSSPRLVQSPSGPGLTVTPGHERGSDHPGFNAPKPQRQVRRRREPAKAPPQRVTRTKRPGR